MSRAKGSKNKATIEREKLAARALALSEAVQAEKTGDVAAEVAAAKAGTKKLGKEILSDFANVLASAAAYYQPRPDGSNPYADEKQFKYYAELAIFAADKAAPFESPRLSAVAVGTAVVTKVEITGGMPDDFAAPGAGQVIDLKPGTIISADDDLPAPDLPRATGTDGA